ncbi:hypothetical protein STRAU_3970 [Streptomyces aurantiacus JA 4570]|uniref:Uncharacterized protein n=1 Tax=Streptomyces aurantiacus JA 4570 TaxID=1286094 RepID=S3ZH76_9ACTN|nr:hypothetical protein STRAU_3970 [Streptomyces aurantiacus JA 4570]
MVPQRVSAGVSQEKGAYEAVRRDVRQGVVQQPEAGRLNSWNTCTYRYSDSARGQHRKTRRCGSRKAPSSRACPPGQRLTPLVSTLCPKCGPCFTSSGSPVRRKVCAVDCRDTSRTNRRSRARQPARQPALGRRCDPVTRM